LGGKSHAISLSRQPVTGQMIALPKQITIVEVSPRDGLQNESVMVPTPVKIEFIQRLADSGLKIIESASFVSPKWVPAMADHSEVIKGIHRQPGVSYPALVPNLRGMELAIAAGIKEISVFTATSETFSKKNANCSLSESMHRIGEVIQLAQRHQIPVRGYISCVIACPYEGAIDPRKTATVVKQLIDMGCEQISLGDTIGVGTPGDVKKLLDVLLPQTPVDKIAVHFHDTYGQALANIYVSLEYGIHIVDSSVAGLGGCPYARSATGNVATEDVIYMLNGLGIETGVDLKKLLSAGRFICQYLNHPPRSKLAQTAS
jgi:hydroxymethylglutaryl-CoA lyase